MHHYATHFNSGYLLQGISLYLSMQRNLKDFTLWILCIDDQVYEILKKANLKNIRLIKKDHWETNELKEVRKTRSFREYCWTLTPSVPNFVFDLQEDIDTVTYIDSDMWLIKSPKPIFDDLQNSNKAVLITEHNYAPEFDETFKSGKYCVQFIIFKRDKSALLRKDWEKRCREWCYAYHDEGRFGDQKYLEQWPINFREVVHSLSIKDAILASWNATRFNHKSAIAWHFHGINLFSKESKIFIDYSYQPIPDSALDDVYDVYLRDLKKAIEIIGIKNVNRFLLADFEKRKPNLLREIKNQLKAAYYRLFCNMSCHKVVEIKFFD